jgi:hyperosmotically inducible protein
MKYSKFTAPVLAAITLAIVGCASTRTQQAPGETIDDRLITGRVKEALIADPDTKARQIDVETFRGVVQLNGFVDSDTDRSKATSVAKQVNGVKQVRNNLQLANAKATVGEIIDDSVITTKVKAALVADPVTNAFQINVETRDGAVQLSGFVDTSEQQMKAAQVARGVSGVRTVKNATEVKKKTYQ